MKLISVVLLVVCIATLVKSDATCMSFKEEKPESTTVYFKGADGSTKKQETSQYLLVMSYAEDQTAPEAGMDYLPIATDATNRCSFSDEHYDVGANVCRSKKDNSLAVQGADGSVMRLDGVLAGAGNGCVVVDFGGEDKQTICQGDSVYMNRQNTHLRRARRHRVRR